MNHSLSKKDSSRFFLIVALGLLMGLHLALFWPGILSPDSKGHFQMAVQGIYSDHHPFVMSWLWRQFHYFISPGPCTMFVFHLVFLYVGAYFFSKAWKPYGWAALFIPFIPGIFSYSGMIWKDVGMALTYFCIAGYLSMITVQKRNLSFYALSALLIILVYGTTIKFQGMYLAPLMLVWMSLLRSAYKFGPRFFSQGLLICGIFYTEMVLLRMISPPVKQDYSWQYVKLFDLAALSVKTRSDLFPAHVKTAHFSLPDLTRRFTSQAVDELCFPSNGVALLKKTFDPKEMNLLWRAWAREIINHPVDYFIHRFKGVGYSLGGTVNWDRIENVFSLQKGTYTYGVLKGFCFIFLAPFFTICVGFFYWCMGILYWKRSPYAKALCMLTTIALTMVGLLLFFSMAGTPRYVYISLCLIHGSHGLAYICLREILSKNLTKLALY